jgi:SAM-dependent methyltransferase
VEEVPCPFCEEADGRLLSTPFGRFGVVKCRRCGLVRLSPRPTAAAARRLYEAAYYDAGGYDDYVATFERFRPLYEKLFARRLALLQRHLPAAPGRLLECGCAHGFQLDWLSRRGWEVAGNDLSATASSYARDRLGLEVLVGPLEEAPLPAAHFDATYLLDLVEHLYQPEEALANVRRALKPGGVLLVQVPYELFHWEKRGQALWEGRAGGTIMPDAVPYHVMFFTPRTLRLLLEKYGFRILGRYSGNYGAVRKRLSPPRLRGDSALETAARLVYYKLGLREALRTLAVRLKQGSGVIYAATPYR